MNIAPDLNLSSGDADFVEQVVQKSGSSFYAAMRILPEAKRRAMYAIYAFCREVDDIADEPGEEGGKRERLAQWRNDIDKLFAAAPPTPITRALAGPNKEFGLDKKDFLAVIDGMEMDAAASVRIADMDELMLYCDRVACAVGRLSNRVFGIDQDRGRRLATSLGMALQLTNILRDLWEDAERDRLYLPADLLRAHGIFDSRPHAVLEHANIHLVCEQLAEIAGRRFDEAWSILESCDRTQMRPAIVMGAMYHAIYRRLLKRGWMALKQPVKLSKLEKLWIVFRHGLI